MRRLMLLRHAKSDRPEGTDDHQRPLAKRGRRTSPLMGTYMAEKGLMPDLAIVSTARRAKETWKRARSAFKHNISRRKEPRIYNASAKAILDIIKETAPDVKALLLVGHNPGLQDLALRLIGKGSQSDLSRLHQKYPTAGLVVIDFDVKRWRDVSDDLGRLIRFETPKSIGDPADVR
ncbi:SixA phosphatase family protein [Phyllobacterium zundukense]|uniref:Histidine phosphatase family protein n=1 Tax=Phyllobacterium zundukense TaxID=1867719 RepID=A0ACD4CXJ1_9HYPH|nr:histidine phosphatase family protein [Phyllobacterium zundukense]UXN58286.1 histidine phosphatase family protein [Phyllobacterium zundukense]